MEHLGRPAARVNPDDLVAIDVHTHAEISAAGHPSLPPELHAASARYFGDHAMPSIDDIAAYYRERRMAAVVFTVDAEHNLGHPPIPNEETAEACARHPDTLIPFASVDPWRGRAGARALRRLAESYGVRGLKLHPSLQGFSPDDPMAFPLYEAAEELGLIVLFHTGQTGIGASVPGGGGVRLRLSDPMLVDDVAARFRELKIILAHPSFPWQDEALAIATHKPNVYIDLSGWSPTYFPPQLVRYANSLLKEKVLFGSDYPVITPDRWLADFEKLDIKDGVRPLILKENAAGLLGLRT